MKCSSRRGFPAEEEGRVLLWSGFGVMEGQTVLREEEGLLGSAVLDAFGREEELRVGYRGRRAYGGGVE